MVQLRKYLNLIIGWIIICQYATYKAMPKTNLQTTIQDSFFTIVYFPWPSQQFIY